MGGSEYCGPTHLAKPEASPASNGLATIDTETADILPIPGAPSLDGNVEAPDNNTGETVTRRLHEVEDSLKRKDGGLTQIIEAGMEEMFRGNLEGLEARELIKEKAIANKFAQIDAAIANISSIFPIQMPAIKASTNPICWRNRRRSKGRIDDPVDVRCNRNQEE